MSVMCVCVCVCVCMCVCVCEARRKQVNMGGGEPTDLSSGYEIMFLLNIFKTECPSLLIRKEGNILLNETERDVAQR